MNNLEEKQTCVRRTVDQKEMREKDNLWKINMLVINEEDQHEITVENFTKE